MISTKIMQGLLAVYVILTFLSAFERNWGRALYFGGAAILTIGVLVGTR